MRAPGSPTLCWTSATSKGVRGAGRASNTAAGSSPRDGRCVMGPMSLLRTTAATHRLSSADRRLPGLDTLRGFPTADMRAHTPRSLVLLAGCRTSAARASASRFGLRFDFAGTRRLSALGGHLVGPGDILPTGS